MFLSKQSHAEWVCVPDRQHRILTVCHLLMIAQVELMQTQRNRICLMIGIMHSVAHKPDIQRVPRVWAQGQGPSSAVAPFVFCRFCRCCGSIPFVRGIQLMGMKWRTFCMIVAAILTFCVLAGHVLVMMSANQSAGAAATFGLAKGKAGWDLVIPSDWCDKFYIGIGGFGNEVLGPSSPATLCSDYLLPALAASNVGSILCLLPGGLPLAPNISPPSL